MAAALGGISLNQVRGLSIQHGVPGSRPQSLKSFQVDTFRAHHVDMQGRSGLTTWRCQVRLMSRVCVNTDLGELLLGHSIQASGSTPQCSSGLPNSKYPVSYFYQFLIDKLYKEVNNKQIL